MKIRGAKVYDPSLGESGVVRNIDVSGGKIADDGPDDGHAVNAEGCAAMAGGIDVHSHLMAFSMFTRRAGEEEAGAGARRLSMEYLKQGITFFVEAGLPGALIGAEAEPGKGVAVDHAVLQLATEGEKRHGRALALKFVGSAGVKTFLAGGREDAGPSPHIHLPNLATGEGYETMAGFIKRLEGRRCHLSHVSYYAFEKSGGRMVSAARKAAGAVGASRNITADAGPVSFGPATAFTADGELIARIASARGTEVSAGEGIPYRAAPHVFRKENFMDSLLWIAGMEFLLYCEDLSRLALSIDFPSGGGMGSYPAIIARLMNRDARNEFLSSLNADAAAASSLKSVRREYTLSEIAAVTRSSPAAICGLKGRGTLRAGAAGDVVLYEESGDIEKMFARPRLVIHNGEVAETA